LPSKRLIEALRALASDPANVVYVVSGRDCKFLDQILGREVVPNLGFSAEHGCFIREPKEEDWTDLTTNIDMTWKADVEEVFHYYEERTTGSFVEKKAASVTFHYRNADPVFGVFQAKECQALLEDRQQKLPIDVIVGKKNLEVRPLALNKGEIVKRLLCQHRDADFALCIGDDRTDEDMFRSLYEIQRSCEKGQKATIPHKEPGSTSPELVQTELVPEKIFALVVDPDVKRKTVANYRMDEPGDVIDMLVQLAGV